MAPAQAAMVLIGARLGAAERAAALALLLQERGLGGGSDDLALRFDRWRGDRGPRAEASRKLAAGWARRAEKLVERERSEDMPLGILLALAFPDMIARRRDARGETWLAAGGRGYMLDAASPLASAEWLAIGDAQGQAKGARILSGAALTTEDVERWLGERIERRTTCSWNEAEGRIEARLERRLGAIVLASGPDPKPDAGLVAAKLLEVATGRLPVLLPRALMARARHAALAGLAPDVLAQSAGEWLAPLLAGRRDLDLPRGAVSEALLSRLDWDARQRLDRLAPREFTSPAGTRHAIDYDDEGGPSVEVRVQALFGLDAHPGIGQPGAPLLLKLTSPAGRPIQQTRDLPGFWRGSWRDVQRDMKGRYPRHRWPDEPWREDPSLKTRNAFEKSKGT